MQLPISLCPSPKRVLATLALLALSSLAAPAVVLVNSDFDTGYTGSNTSLNGQSGSGDVNLAGSYVSNTTGVNVNVNDSSTTNNNLTYNVDGGGTIDGGLHSVRMSTSGVSGGVGYTRSLSSNFGGQTIYLRIVVSSTAPFASTYLQFRLGLTDGTNSVVGLADGFSPLTVPVASSSLNGTTIRAGTMATGTPNLIVAAFNWTGAGYTSMNLWLNPTATDLATPDATSAVTSFNPTFNSIGLNILNNPPNDRSYAFDSFRVATTWAEVVPQVPEPGAAALLIAGCAFGHSRRRRCR